jgi:signal peptidase
MENQVVVKKTKKETIISIAKTIGNVIFYVVIIGLLLFSIMNINAGSKNGGFPNIFGKGFLAVQTDSMTRDGDRLDDLYADYEVGEFARGDLLYANVINEKNINDLQVGDVVTFFDTSINALNTHRIIIVDKDEAGKVTRLVLQGDLSASLSGVYDPSDADKSQQNQYLISSGNVQFIGGSDLELIKGKITGVAKGVGTKLEFVQQHWLWLFVVPVLLFLLIEVFLVVRNVMELKGAKQKAEIANDKEAMLAELEAQKEEMRKQILAELQAQVKAEAQNAESTDEEKSE